MQIHYALQIRNRSFDFSYNSWVSRFLSRSKKKVRNNVVTLAFLKMSLYGLHRIYHTHSKVGSCDLQWATSIQLNSLSVSFSFKLCKFTNPGNKVTLFFTVTVSPLSVIS